MRKRPSRRARQHHARCVMVCLVGLALALPCCVDLTPPWPAHPIGTGGSGETGGAGGDGSGGMVDVDSGAGGTTEPVDSSGQGGAGDVPLDAPDAPIARDAADAPLAGNGGAGVDAGPDRATGGTVGAGGTGRGGATGTGGPTGTGGATGIGGVTSGGKTGTGGVGGNGAGGVVPVDGGSACVGRPAGDGGAGGIGQGLIAYYGCNQSSGATLTDELGKNDGTLAIGPASTGGASGTGGAVAYSFSTGKVGTGALALSAAGRGYASLPAPLLDNLCDITVATWVNIKTSTDWPRIFDFGKNQNVYMFLTPRNSVTGVVRFAISLTGFRNGEERVDGSSALPTGVWSHVAVVLGASGATLYVNGTAVGTNAAVVLRPADLGTGLNNYIGRSQFSDDPYLDGSIDDFRIYGRALSAGEIQTLASM